MEGQKVQEEGDLQEALVVVDRMAVLVAEDHMAVREEEDLQEALVVEDRLEEKCLAVLEAVGRLAEDDLVVLEVEGHTVVLVAEDYLAESG